MRKKRQLTDFGVEVKKILIDRDMTQAELAERVGIKRQYLSLILCGERRNSRYVDEIRKVLGMSA